MGIIRRSASPWASPHHMVQKPAGGWRPFGDYRRLNSITEADRYAIPHIHDFSARLSGATMFSKVDLVRGYHQVPVAEEDIPNTTKVQTHTKALLATYPLAHQRFADIVGPFPNRKVTAIS